MKSLNSILVLFVTVFIFSCSKGPGPGGTSTVKGQIVVEDYNQTFTTLWATYYCADCDVYLRYGDNPTYSEHVKSGPEGDYEFTYLSKGNYSVYVYSKDSSLQAPSGQISIIEEFEITENKQVVIVPTLKVFG